MSYEITKKGGIGIGGEARVARWDWRGLAFAPLGVGDWVVDDVRGAAHPEFRSQNSEL
jgi:hypothetical protein